jgi:hypothetical protein
VAEPEPDLEISNLLVWPNLAGKGQPTAKPDPVSSQNALATKKATKKATKSALQEAAQKPDTDDFRMDELIMDVEEQIEEGTTMIKQLTTNDDDMEIAEDGKKRGHDEVVKPAAKEGFLVVVTKKHLSRAIGDLSKVQGFNDWLKIHPAGEHLKLVNELVHSNLMKLSEQEQHQLSFLPIENQIPMMIHMLDKKTQEGTKK